MNKGYIDGNKEAWEESFAKSIIGFGESNADRLKNEHFPFLDTEFIGELEKYDLAGKKVLQLCCNNGREIMSITKGVKATLGVGIDIAENIVNQAKINAEKAEIDCEFYAGNVLELKEKFIGQFDAVFVMIGAICWFEDLTEFFKVASLYLKKDGILFVYDIHPASNMIPLEGDEGYDKENPMKVTWSYFKEEPFEDTSGMVYVAGTEYKSKVFTSFSYTMADIINGMSLNGLRILNVREFDYDVSGNFIHLNGKGFPLTFMMTSKKEYRQ